ncbi:MAG TPA: autotransporter-associated beta strand repeat-containing protein [Gemmataceae bacterium]|jgi:autotransporter-associated beta strand protein
MLRTRPTGRAAAVFLLALVSTSPAAGQTWTGAASNLWNVAANWTSNPVLPPSNPNTRLTFAETPTINMVNNIPGTFQLNRMTFGILAPNYSVGGNALDFRRDGSGVFPQIVMNSSIGVAIGNDLVLTDTLTVAGTGPGGVALNGTLSGPGGLTMSGAGTLTLGGAANTFAGTVEVNSGALSLGSPTAIPGGRSVSVRRGAEFRIGAAASGDNAAAPLGALGLTGATFRVASTNAEYYVDQLLITESGGTGGAIDFGGASNFRLHLTGAVGGILVIGDTTWTGSATSRIQNDRATPIDIVTNGSTIANGIRLANGTSGRGFRLTGGGTMVLSNAANSAHLIADGSALEVADMAHLGSGGVTLQGAGAGGPGTLKYTGAAAASSKPLVLNTGGGRVWLTSPGTNLTLSGMISEAAPGQQLVVAGIGGTTLNTTLTLTGANTYTGPTIVTEDGGLSVPSLPNGGMAGPVGASTNDPANLVLGVGSKPGRLEYTGPTASTDRGITLGPGTTGSVTVTNAASNLTVSGLVTGGGVTKGGAGTLTLANGTNDFSGLIVALGTLAVSHPTAVPASSPVFVTGGGQFRIAFGAGGNSGGPIGTLTLDNNARFAVPTPGSTDYYLNRLEQGAGGRVDLTGSTDFALHLTGAGAGINVAGNGTWTGAGTSRIRNDTAAPLDLSIAPGATLTSSIRLINGASQQGYRLTGGGTLVVTNTDNAATLTVGPATLQFDDVTAFTFGPLTVDGGTLAYTGGTAVSFKSFTLTAAGGTVSVTDPATTLSLAAEIGGGSTLTKTGRGGLRLTGANALGGLVVNTGWVGVDADFPLGAGPVVVNPAGTLRYTYPTVTARTFTLDGGTLEAASGIVLTLNGATVNGGVLASTLGGRFVLTNSAAVNGATLFGGTTVDVNGPAALANVTTGANVAVAAGRTLTLTRGRQTSAGTLTVNGTVSAPQGWESTGVLRITGGSNPGLITVGGAPLVLGGGSRTYVGANAAGQRGGTILLGGNTLELNGGLLVNNGDFIAPNNGGIQQGTVNVNYGSLAKGSGYYEAVNVTDGGKYAPGNSIADTFSGSLTLNSGSVYEFEINRATGTAGGGGTAPPQGWDRLTLGLSMTVTATPASPAVIQLVTRNAADTGPGTLPDFDVTQSYRWEAFRAEAFNGFAPDKFTFDTAQFANLTNPAGVGAFGLERTGGSVFVTYTPAPEPGLVLTVVAAAGLVAGRFAGRRQARAALGGKGR